MKCKMTEVQSQQMAFTQSPSLSNNPKIPTYYLIFPVTNVHWRKDRELLYEAANWLQIGNFKTGKFKL